jgi:hypothetical protein
MAVIPEKRDPTLQAADDALVAVRSAEGARLYLGASEVGHECRRRSWYSFRQCVERQISASGYRAIEDGERGEGLIIQRLRRVHGLQLYDVDPDNGKQFSVSAVGGHFRGHMDGVVLGLIQAPKTWAVFEAKVVNEKKFAKLLKLRAEDEKTALKKWDERYYWQAVSYMGLAELTRHWLVCATPGVRDWTSVRTDFDKAELELLLAKAAAIVNAPEPLEKVSSDPAYYVCKQCDASRICHEKVIPKPNCRNCVHSTPEMNADGRWSCAFLKRDISAGEQMKGCEHHVLIPALVPLEFVEGDEAGNFAEYKRPGGEVLRNGSGDKAVYTSAELYAAQDDLTRLYEATLNWLRMNMGGRLESVRPEPPKEFDDWEQVRQALPLKSERVDIHESEIPF